MTTQSDLSGLKLKRLRKGLAEAFEQGDASRLESHAAELHKRFEKSNGDNALERTIVEALIDANCQLTEQEKAVFGEMETFEKNEESIFAHTSNEVPAKGNACSLGQPFANPYTFLPFDDSKPIRREPISRTADESDSSRISGILEFDAVTESPLLSSEGVSFKQNENGHCSYRALRIGNDVIYPATGVRGSFRSLMTAVTGNGLRYLDKNAYLVDGRVEKDVYNKNHQLALIVRTGTSSRSGKVVLGSQEKISLEKLEREFGITDEYRERDKPIWVRKLSGGKLEFDFNSKRQPEGFDYILKLSGRPIQRNKCEWLFKPDHSRTIQLEPAIWMAYLSRYKGSIHEELNSGDVVWLEPSSSAEDAMIESPHDVESIQWSRWGKGGDLMLEKIPFPLRPDYMLKDNRVGEVTALFGQVPAEKEYFDTSPTVAGRIRPDNLVFKDAVSRLYSVDLAPLANPNPGCRSFYRVSKSLKKGSDEVDFLRGYKIYKTTSEKGAEAPHNYDVQPVFKDGEKLPKEQKMSKTVELLPEESRGHLCISFTALSPREYALLRLVTDLPLRFGGGKPFGLGLTKLTLRSVKDVFGKEVPEPVPEWRSLVKDLEERADLYRRSQNPVNHLRYPRAAESNRSRTVVGGHVWFGRFAALDSNKKSKNLEVSQNSNAAELFPDGWVDAQLLPDLESDSVLYGYDLFLDLSNDEGDKQRLVSIELFDPSAHSGLGDRSGKNVSPNAERRASIRSKRES